MSISAIAIAPVRRMLADGKVEMLEYPSTFPIANRPVYFWDASPRIMVDHRMSFVDEKIWISRIDAIIRSRAVELDRSGIIQSVSYSRARKIMLMSRFADRMIWHDDSSGSERAIEEFKARAGKGAVLISPSMTMGVNFSDDFCRWILWPKMPYPDMRSPVMQRRAKLDKRYAGSLMMKALIQGCGRGNRHIADWCESVIIDGHAKRWLYDYSEFMTGYFKQALRTTMTMPQPLDIE